jgi:hypothetical protein
MTTAICIVALVCAVFILAGWVRYLSACMDVANNNIDVLVRRVTTLEDWKRENTVIYRVKEQPAYTRPYKDWPT